MSQELRDFINRKRKNFISYCSSATNSFGPAIIMIDVDFTNSDWIKRVANEFAEHGYIVLVPNISKYFGSSLPKKPIHHNESQTLSKSESLIDFSAAIIQIEETINLAKSIPQCNGKVGVVGFSSGATLAYLVAARLKPDAAVAYFATQLQNFLEEGKSIACPLLIHLYEFDDVAQTQENRKIEAALIGKGNISIYTYTDRENRINPLDPVFYTANDINALHQRTFKLIDRLK